MASTTIVFVHGYSVTNLNTYGEMPLRLREEAAKAGINITIEEIFLGRYISFNDEVRLQDVSRAFKTAVNEQLGHIINSGGRFVCITHSTGGPVMRDWWSRYYFKAGKKSPMSHLIMLAPANFGSALAQLGKGKLSRLKAWFDGVEPGQGVLNWLELGSAQAWNLNKEWIMSDGKQISANDLFPFVLTGQSIDRKLYDALNSYTGELGSDGVVRVATTNLNSRYIKLIQPTVVANKSNEFEVAEYVEAPTTAMRIITNKAHSGDEIGILKSVKKQTTDAKNSETINAILSCLKVTNNEQYNNLIKQFNEESEAVQKNELVEIEKNLLIKDRVFIHDRFSQVIFRVTDSEGHPITDYDLILTAGPKSDPNQLPQGFAIDRQKNQLNRETITYFFNYDKMKGAPAIKDKNGDVLRGELIGAESMGFEILPRPDKGFVRYVPCKINANKELLENSLHPNSTTLIDIVLQRLVSTEVFRMEKVENTMPTKKQGDFSSVKPGDAVVE